MILSMTYQIQLFIKALLIGVIGGFLYDAVRIFRLIFPHKKFIVEIEDCIFWIVFSFFVFVALYIENYGRLRGYYIIGILIGMTLYYFGPGKIVIGVSDIIIKYLKKIIKFTVKLFLYPFGVVINILKRPANFVMLKLKKFKKILKKYLKKYVKYAIIFISKVFVKNSGTQKFDLNNKNDVKDKNLKDFTYRG